ncbi:hypothetical protein HELRODRAFT_78579 [Helobdella robusta]|uniref:WD repeat-containing protein 65 n=1 Tax=Helobdella robusta TaxID=6412 RepID=T1G3D2_HELRO|nr:hypothetical protein HELRODRAFT_78579 [Helobdella robusta]ESO04898.1 hypothetical protein HELRODRAFT_78579 [Helobdella robusta]
MALVELKTHYHFGLTAAVSGSLIFVSDHIIAYPSGAGVIIHNIDSNTQQVCPTVSRSRGVTAMAYFEPNKILAAAEKSDGDKPFISFFEVDWNQLKRRKAVQPNQIQSDRFESLSFSSDGKFLAAIGGPPDHLLAIWMWDSKSQALGKIKLANFATGLPPPIQGIISFNPVDSQRFVIFGRETLRQYVIHISNIVPYKHSRNEGQLTAWVVCLAWVNEDAMLVGLDSNTVQLYEGGELKQEFRISYLSETDFMLSGIEDPDEYAIRCISVFEKGFVCSCGRGKVHMFEKSDDVNERYKKLREIELVQRTTKGDTGGYALTPFITALTLNTSQKVFACLTDSGFVYAYDLLKDYRKDVKPQLYLITSRVHNKEITSVDVCVRKPLIVTSSLDKTVLLWNYVTCHLELYKEFVEPVYSVSLHPDGLCLIAGLEKSLKLMNIFVDEIYLLRTFQVSNCRTCRFSNGGQYFAVANWSVIEIYSSITLQVVYHLRGHVDRVNRIFWSKNDVRLVSVSEDGEAFEWDVLASKKVSENVLKHCRYYDTCIEGKSIFVVGSDFVVKEIQDSTITKRFSANGIQITRIAINNLGRCMFLGLWTGALRSLQYPLTEPDEYLEFQGHFAPITGLRVTPDDQLLVSISEDSVVIVWTIVDSKLITQSKFENLFSKEVLANPIDLEDKNKRLNRLEVKVEQLKMENQLQLHNRDAKYNDNLAKVTHKLKSELEQVKQKNFVGFDLEKENSDVQEKYSQHLNDMIKKLRSDCALIEQKNKDKLKVEAEKYQALREQGTQSQEEFEQELEEKNKKLSSLQNSLALTLASIKSEVGLIF